MNTKFYDYERTINTPSHDAPMGNVSPYHLGHSAA